MAAPSADLVVGDLSDGAARVVFPGEPEAGANRRAAALARALAAAAPAGFEDAVVGAASLLLLFDPATTSATRLLEQARETETRGEAGEERSLRVPVVYGGPHAGALEALARELSLSAEELVRMHAAAEYRVAFLGFAPGFAYMTGLPERLAAPRLETPALRMPAGSVAIAGPYTSIYPGGTPGGWRAIGIAPVRVFDPAHEPPSLFSPGDRVRFEAAAADAPMPPAPAAPPPRGAPVLRVVSPGAFALVTGPPRRGVSGWGLAPGGPMDPLAAALANRGAGNPESAAVLESNLTPPRLEVLRPIRLCWWGSGEARDGDTRIAPGAAFDAAVGDVLAFPSDGDPRMYLAVAGGLEAPLSPSRLAAGELVCAAPEPPAPEPPARRREAPPPGDAIEVRVVPGLEHEIFDAATREALRATEWRVSAHSDRRGLRLEGPPIPLAGRPEVPSEGAPLGAIQVPPDGVPIVFGPDRPLTAGYARIANVISADWRLLAQARPGHTRVRFREVTLEEAVAARAGSVG
ncbi:MAG TPA: 5-oxoprolinase subunit PxpB [Thermoanaerobaculia bacterium]